MCPNHFCGLAFTRNIQLQKDEIWPIKAIVVHRFSIVINRFNWNKFGSQTETEGDTSTIRGNKIEPHKHWIAKITKGIYLRSNLLKDIIFIIISQLIDRECMKNITLFFYSFFVNQWEFRNLNHLNQNTDYWADERELQPTFKLTY